ncbi:GAF and ANTAR domain-containing protein [Nocardioides koreensis]|uniref:GAF and ANTAR domain-containing protein n=1 Tax=Nocardioides koreensis TaxID=433651 RepID=A0ABN2Z705_9ACTN
MEHNDLARRMAALARELQESRDLQATIEHAVELADKNIVDCDGAAISLVRRGRDMDTPAATDESAAAADRLQVELGQGPCLDAIAERRLVASDDLVDDARWPAWGPRVAADTGLRSALCFRLFTQGATVGALSLYSRRVQGFGEVDREVGGVLAAHVAVAMATAQQVETLGVAVDARTVIGQAQGILMERYDIDAERAFAVLKRISTTSNVKLHEIAQRLVVERTLPKPPQPTG